MKLYVTCNTSDCGEEPYVDGLCPMCWVKATEPVPTEDTKEPNERGQT